jgi:DNA-binding MarR family transcriptional regulator
VSPDDRISSSADDLVRSAPDEGSALVRTYMSEPEQEAWLGLVETYESLVRALDAQLLAEHGVSLSAFEALLQIAHTDGGTIGVSDLANRIRLSQSRVSRLVAELENKGLVERRRSTTDARSTHAVISEAGWTRLRQAAPTYLQSVRTNFLDGLAAKDIENLRRVWKKVGALHQ